MKTKKYSEQELISLLQDYAQKHGEPPSKRQLKEGVNMPSEMAFRTAFGSWGNAIKAAGFEVKKPFPSLNTRLAVSKAKKGKRGELSSHWKGGRFISDNGYVMIWNPETQKYNPEHRIIMENHLGRKLNSNEDVHHKNKIKTDNRLENLEVLLKSSHTKLHENDDKHTRKNRSQCIYPGCIDITSSKYFLCREHYKLQWWRLKNNLINGLHDFTPIKKELSEETKQRLSEYAKKQKRVFGRFSSE